MTGDAGATSATEAQGASLRRAGRADLDAAERLLRVLELPTDGVADWIERFWVAEHAGTIVGVAGIERYGAAGLLRSVAVARDWQGSGIGRRLVDRVLEESRAAGVRDVFLLTTTAEGYFLRLGFTWVGRERVPDGMRASAEFTGACPASAVVMRKELFSAGPVPERS